jgi:hypothetical protein
VIDKRNPRRPWESSREDGDAVEVEVEVAVQVQVRVQMQVQVPSSITPWDDGVEGIGRHREDKRLKG